MNITITRGSTGLNTQNDPVRSYHHRGSSSLVGLSDLSSCANIDISDNGRISRRKPISRIVSLSAHSLHPVGNRYCLFVSSGKLYLLYPDLTTYSELGEIGDGTMDAVVVDGIAYWCNGAERGKVIDGAMVEWTKPSTVYGNKTKVFDGPPVGSLIEEFNGRMYMASGQAVWYSEPFGPDLWNLAEGFLSFESDVKMVVSALGGLYVSDSENTWFLGGTGPDDFSWKLVDNSPALPYSSKNAVGYMATDDNGVYSWVQSNKMKTALWLTDECLMYGSNDGQVINLSKNKVELPCGYSSGAILVNGSDLIANFVE